MSTSVIGIDIRVLVLGKRTGVEEYLLNLLPRLIAQNPEIKFRLFYSALRKQKLSFPWLSRPNVELCEFSLPNNLLLFPATVLLSQPKLNRLIGGCDVFWSPHIFNAAVSKNTWHVVTVHDLAFERYPEFFSLGKRLWHKFLMQPRQQLRRADRIIAVSHSTKSDLEKLYGISGDKISVIHPGVGGEFHPLEKSDPVLARIREKYELPERFILFFGTIEPRKNITSLIRAFELLKSYKLKAKSYKLIIAGTKGWLYEEVFDAVRKSSVASDIVFVGFVDPEDKPALYNLADIFVYPSFYEGFGFPPLEAMACGVPVVTSNCASLPEVVGDAAIMVNPHRSAEIARAIAMLLADRPARDLLAQRGLERAKRFSWDICVTETVKILLGA